MLEIVFGESACSSLKIAKGSERTDVYCFDIALSVGTISDDGLGLLRKNVLRQMLSFDPGKERDILAEERMEKTKSSLSSLLGRYKDGEPVRIWYSCNPDELCGMYWLMAQLRPLKCRTAIYLVRLPVWEYRKEHAVISRNGWGDVDSSEWETYLSMQEEVQPTALSYCSMEWQRLREENAPLRVMLNGKLQSAPEDIYDSFIFRELERQPEEFKMAYLIGGVLGRYQLGIGDVLIARRIEKMIADGILEVVREASAGELSYRRILRKTGKQPEK